MEILTVDELKECKEKRIPIIIHNSYKFSIEPTYIISVKEHEGFGGIVEVEGSIDKYEGYRIRKYGS